MCSHAQVEGYRGLPFRRDITSLSNPMDRYKLTQSPKATHPVPWHNPQVEKRRTVLGRLRLLRSDCWGSTHWSTSYA